jgi:hypothetical protein
MFGTIVSKRETERKGKATAIAHKHAKTRRDSEPSVGWNNAAVTGLGDIWNLCISLWYSTDLHVGPH